VVSSTAYCLTGVMANGQRVFRGAVAMNGVPLGSRWRVVETGEVFVVADRIGHGSGFDIAMPGDCDGARRYGRRTITVERVQ
jgi:3D (Asp-Asp-Asp) domain-containing protein